MDSSTPNSATISARIGAFEFSHNETRIDDGALERSAGKLFASPSAQPPYCDLKTAMITTCVGDDMLEAIGEIHHNQPRSSNQGLLCF